MRNDLWNYLKGVTKPIVLYGMGNGADKIISVLNSKGIEFKGVFASDNFVRTKTFHGMPVTTYANAKEKFKDMIVLVCFGSARLEVVDNIKRIASEQELYAPDVPVCGETLFDIDYYNANKEMFESITDIFADTLSKKTFLNTVDYKLSGNLKPLFDCEISQDEPYNTFLKFSDNEIYLDLGAYRGDTVRDFLQRVNGYEKIIAVEPDLKTYGKLLNELEDVKHLTALNACVSDIVGERLFIADGSRGSKISTSGRLVNSVTVDSLIDNKGCSYIKMDIEGEEIKAINGAIGTIKSFKPKMQIACYHRSEDLIQIPEAVLSIRDDYKVYMRHFPSVPAWDTCFFFV